MRVFTCTDHNGHWVGVASVVVADDEAAARSLLDTELKTHGLQPNAYSLQEINTAQPRAFVLQSGNY